MDDAAFAREKDRFAVAETDTHAAASPTNDVLDAMISEAPQTFLAPNSSLYSKSLRKRRRRTTSRFT